ncbi:MAG: hypothetical protein QXI58_06855 [Candidatus Micrarchaeia archaeon]
MKNMENKKKIYYLFVGAASVVALLLYIYYYDLETFFGYHWWKQTVTGFRTIYTLGYYSCITGTTGSCWLVGAYKPQTVCSWSLVVGQCYGWTWVIVPYISEIYRYMYGPYYRWVGKYGYFHSWDVLKNLTNPIVVRVDTDQDGVWDDEDQCPEQYGKYFAGCPASLHIIAENHTLIIEENKNKPRAKKLPISGLLVEVYNLSEIKKALKLARVSGSDDDEFDEKIREKISPRNYTWIRSQFTPLHTCITNESGECRIGVEVWECEDEDSELSERCGKYIVIGVSENITKYMHLAKYVEVEENTTEDVKLKIISVPQIAKLISGKVSKIKGSGELYVIEPDFLTWSETTEVYPYIIYSEDAWGVETTVYPPSGWVSDTPYVDAVVNASTDTAMFTLNAVSTEADKIGSKIVARHIPTGRRIELKRDVEIEPVGPLKEKIEREKIGKWWKGIPFLGALVDGIISDAKILILAIVAVIIIIIVALKMKEKKKWKKRK